MGFIIFDLRSIASVPGVIKGKKDFFGHLCQNLATHALIVYVHRHIHLNMKHVQVRTSEFGQRRPWDGGRRRMELQQGQTGAQRCLLP